MAISEPKLIRIMNVDIESTFSKTRPILDTAMTEAMIYGKSGVAVSLLPNMIDLQQEYKMRKTKKSTKLTPRALRKELVRLEKLYANSCTYSQDLHTKLMAGEEETKRRNSRIYAMKTENSNLIKMLDEANASLRKIALDLASKVRP